MISCICTFLAWIVFEMRGSIAGSGVAASRFRSSENGISSRFRVKWKFLKYRWAESFAWDSSDFPLSEFQNLREFSYFPSPLYPFNYPSLISHMCHIKPQFSDWRLIELPISLEQKTHGSLTPLPSPIAISIERGPKPSMVDTLSDLWLKLGARNHRSNPYKSSNGLEVFKCLDLWLVSQLEESEAIKEKGLVQLVARRSGELGCIYSYLELGVFVRVMCRNYPY